MSREIDGVFRKSRSFIERGQIEPVVASLAEYADIIRPWAEEVSRNALLDVSRLNRTSWMALAKKLNRALVSALSDSSIGERMRILHVEQVGLIRSLPLEAAIRAQELAQKAFAGGNRAQSIIDEIMRSGEVTEGRARNIARTEIGKANSQFTRARAEFIGAPNYFWRTSEDTVVRDSHRKMNGRIFAFASPPEVDEGGSYNPGEIYGCRCFAEPIVSGLDIFN